MKRALLCTLIAAALLLSACSRASESTVRAPARSAAMDFSFSPPIGSTRPRSEISPVMAMFCGTGRPDSAE